MSEYDDPAYRYNGGETPPGHTWQNPEPAPQPRDEYGLPIPKAPMTQRAAEFWKPFIEGDPSAGTAEKAARGLIGGAGAAVSAFGGLLYDKLTTPFILGDLAKGREHGDYMQKRIAAQEAEAAAGAAQDQEPAPDEATSSEEGPNSCDPENPYDGMYD